MMNKRGQFYIIAAVIILVIVAGIITVKTYVNVEPEPRSIQSMGDELSEESFRVVNYGIYNSENITKVLNNFTDNYAPYFTKKTNNANVIFIYGNSTFLYSAKFDNESTGKVSANIGSGSPNWNMDTSFVNRTRITTAPGITKVTVTIFNNSYDFDIKEKNEMFYFIIVQEKEGEVYVEKNG